MMGNLVQIRANLSQGGDEFPDYGDFDDRFLFYRDPLAEDGFPAVFRNGYFRLHSPSLNGGIVWRFKTNRYAMVEYWFVFLMIVSHWFSFP